MRSSHLLLLASLLLLSACVAVARTVVADTPEVRAPTGWNISLQCTAELKQGVAYLAVSWYKLEKSPSLHRSGLLRKELPDGPTRLYEGMYREVELLDEAHSILLPSLACSDSGVYICSLAAPVGEQNREGRILLSVEDCPTDTVMETVIRDTSLVLFATALLIIALLIFILSHYCLKNTLKEKVKKSKTEILLDAPLKPLEKKDLMLIYTLGPKASSMKHICV
ncbi:CD83 antigen [Oryzias latipes]|uniref:Ig-like domain-containing protein n=1 Tax=Oryzias latipes TaxID=8090 RepID=H2MLN2_ORYLA|nr:CD83 antigen [Oryzias latipes]